MGEHQRPRISVVLPTYRPDLSFLRAALASVAGQTVPPDEVVITDDTSPEPAPALLRLLDGLDATVVVRGNPTRLGMVGNWNASVEASGGDLVAMLHQDDILEPQALELMSEVFVSEPNLAVCGVGETSIDERGVPTATTARANHRDRLFVSEGRHHLTYRELSYLMLKYGQVFAPPSAMMFSRTHFDRIGGFNPAYTQSADIDFVLRMARSGGATYLNRRLVQYRYHSTNATLDNVASGRAIQDRRRLYEEHIVTTDYTRRELGQVRANLVIRAGYDAARAMGARRWATALVAGRDMARTPASPAALARRATQIVRRVNEDAR